MVEEVEAISEQTSTEASNASAAAEEQTSSLTEVTRRVEELNGRASRLQDLLDEFTLEGSAGQAGGPPSAPAGSDGPATATTDGGRPAADEARADGSASNADPAP